jgi:hypothetical protein
MRDRPDPDSEERERLERLREWRRAVGGNRGAPDRRSLFVVVGTLTLGIVAVVLIVTPTGRPLNTRRPLGSEPTRASAEDVAIPSSDSLSAVLPSSPGAGVSASLEPIERAPAKERPPVETRRPPRIEPREPRHSGEPVKARALPQRPRPSPRPPLAMDRAHSPDVRPQLRRPHRRQGRLHTPRRALVARRSAPRRRARRRSRLRQSPRRRRPLFRGPTSRRSRARKRWRR